MICKKCGAQLPENSKFCEKCGTPVSETVPPEYVAPTVQPIPKSFSNKKNIIIIIAAAIILIAGAITAIAIGTSNSGTTSIAAQIELAEKYLSEQNYEQAIIEFQKAIEIEPMNADAYIGLADAYIGMGNTEKAIEVLDEGLEKTGDSRLQNKLEDLKAENTTSENTASENPTDDSQEFINTAEYLRNHVNSDTTRIFLLNKERYMYFWSIENPEEEMARLKEQSDVVAEVGETIDEATLNELSKYTHITDLTIFGCHLSNLDFLSNYTNLNHLNIYINDVEDCSVLANIPSIVHLQLAGNNIKDISPLVNLPSLTHLDIGSNPIADVSPIYQISTLQMLNAPGVMFGDISEMANLTELYDLSIANSDIQDISVLSNLTELRYIYLVGNQISDVSPLYSLSKLESLYLSENPISDEDIEKLRQALPNCEITF